MARGRGRPQAAARGDWVRSLGEELGSQLGRIIAESVQKSLVESIDVNALAQRLSAGVNGGSRRGRKPATGARAICTEPGCGRPVLAKGMCRSHYYRARYRAQKGESARRGRKGRRASAAAESGTP